MNREQKHPALTSVGAFAGIPGAEDCPTPSE